MTRVRRGLASVAFLATVATVARAQAPAPAKVGDAAEEPSAPSEGPPVTPSPSEAPPAEPAAAPPESPDTQSATMLAYQKALEKRRLAPTAPLSAQRLRDELAVAEEKLVAGRRDEAIGDLVYLVESPRFQPFATSPEGKTARFLLGDALGRAGAHELARGYLVALLEGDPNDMTYRRSVHTLVDLGLESDRPLVFLSDLEKVPPAASDEMRGDIAYLAGRAFELENKPEAALAEYAKVKERSRFWAQATYLSGVVEVERKNYREGERLFCKLADPKKTPRQAALFGGGDFFRVRDLARLGLGRVAHEQYRFDDARYYYYLVPQDSERLPEALYETATTRYEAKDYDGARQSMDDLRRVATNHPYEDEAW
ncbi:MAG TPA: tetratricopeptide repeat protein, partial [Polyangiaceae bacterium]